MYDVTVPRPDGRQGPTIRGLTYAQKYALMNALKHYNIKPLVKTIEREMIYNGKKAL